MITKNKNKISPKLGPSTKGPKKFVKPTANSNNFKKKLVVEKKSKVEKVTEPVEQEAQKSFTIYVGNLNYQRSEQGLSDLFRKYGRVKKVHMLTRPGSKLKMGIAFVDMYDEGDAFRAIKGLNGALVDGRTLKVSQANEFGKEPETKITYKARLGGAEKKPVATANKKTTLPAKEENKPGEREFRRSNDKNLATKKKANSKERYSR